MTTTIVGQAGMLPAALPLRAIDAENRQDNWLRHMEQAQLQAMAAAGVLAGPAAASAAAAPAPPQPVAFLRTGASDAAAVRAHERDDAAPHADTERAGRGGAAGRAASSGSDAESGTAASEPSAAQDKAPVHQARAQRAVPGAVQEQAAALATPLPQAPQQAAAVPLAPRVAGVRGAAAHQDIQAGTANAAARVAQRPADLAMPGLSPAAPEEESRLAAAEAPPPMEPVELGEEWKKHMLHVMAEDGQADVWIRDNSLNAAQVSGVLARLAFDLAGMGLQLREVTVNGKPSLRGRPTDEDAAFRFEAEDKVTTEPAVLHNIEENAYGH